MADAPTTSASMEFPPNTSTMDFSQSVLPLLPLDDNAPEFDYTAFFQGDEADYLGDMAEDSSASNSTNVLASEHSPLQQSSVSPQPPAQVVKSNAQPKQRLERRGHTKSRRGCYNCKRRRIKCQETKPACGHCLKTGLRCEYPTLTVTLHQPHHQIPLFSMQDMRFFQHFLIHCSPHQRTGSEHVWLHEIPCLCEKYDYLMHAILGFAASDLLEQDNSLIGPAMQHRFKAVKAIRKTLTEVPKANTFEEGNALMATCFVLTFQSVNLDDGMTEYMTFIRGIIIVAMQMHHKSAMHKDAARSLFDAFMGMTADDQSQSRTTLLDQQSSHFYMQNMPLLERNWINPAFNAIQALGSLCRHPVEMTYHKMILDMAKQLYVSSWEAYRAMTKHYGWWMMLSHENFQHLVDPTNPVCILLATHWIALKQTMAVVMEREMVGRHHQHQQRNSLDEQQQQGSSRGLVRWLRYLNRLVETDYAPYNQWPTWVETQMDRGGGFFLGMGREAARR